MLKTTISIRIDQTFWQQKVILPLIMRRAYLGYYLYFNSLPNEDCETKQEPYSYQVFKDYHGDFHHRGFSAWKYYLGFSIYLRSLGIVKNSVEQSWVQSHTRFFYVCVLFGWKWLAPYVVKYKKHLLYG